MTYEDLIPTFKVGERVIVHHRPVEFFCPRCKSPKPMATFDAEGFIMDSSLATEMWSDCCRHVIKIPEGWLLLKIPSKRAYACVPYTLLERIE